MDASHSHGRATAPSGFRWMELVVVLTVVASLGAVGAWHLSEAHDPVFTARMERLAGAMQTASTGFHGHWKVKGEVNVDVPGWADGTVDANSFGFPAGSRRDATEVRVHQDCADIWRALLQNAPRVTEADPTRETGMAFTDIEAKLGTEVEFVAGVAPTIVDATVPLPASPADGICQFISLHYQSVQPGAPKPTLFYDSRSGTVILDLERRF